MALSRSRPVSGLKSLRNKSYLARKQKKAEGLLIPKTKKNPVRPVSPGHRYGPVKPKPKFPIRKPVRPLRPGRPGLPPKQSQPIRKKPVRPRRPGRPGGPKKPKIRFPKRYLTKKQIARKKILAMRKSKKSKKLRTPLSAITGR